MQLRRSDIRAAPCSVEPMACRSRLISGYRGFEGTLMPMSRRSASGAQPSRREFGLWVALLQPSGERRNDGKADDEDADAHEDLDAAFLGLVANLPRGGEKQHHGERVQAVHEPVALGLG